MKILILLLFFYAPRGEDVLKENSGIFELVSTSKEASKVVYCHTLDKQKWANGDKYAYLYEVDLKTESVKKIDFPEIDKEIVSCWV